VLTNIAFPGSESSIYRDGDDHGADHTNKDADCPEFMKEMHYQANNFADLSKEA